VRGIYKGASSPLAGAMFHNAGVFFSYGQGREMRAHARGVKMSELRLMDYFYAGLFSGAFVSHIETPVDLLKSKLQAQIGTGKYKSVWDCARQLYAERGLRALYQGYASVQMRNIPAFGTYFYFFEWSQRKLTKPGERPTLGATFLSGGWAGFGFWGIFYPFDLIKTRMQTDASTPSERKYRHTLHCIQETFRTEGMSAFFKGYTPSLIRALLVNACIFSTVEAAKRAMH